MSANDEALVRQFSKEFCDKPSRRSRRPANRSRLRFAWAAGATRRRTRRRLGTRRALPGGCRRTRNVREIFSTDDLVVARWIGTGTRRGELMGIDPTDKLISDEAISVFRIAHGKIDEEWTVWDALGLLQQIGAVPVPA